MAAFWAYDGSTWRSASTVWAYDGASWRSISTCWVYDGSTWRQVCGGGCSCTGVTIDSFNRTDDPTGCVCSGGAKNNYHYVTVRWTYSGATNACHHVRVERSSNGSSWTSYATGIDVDNTSGCTVGAYEGCYTTPSCVVHLYYWRIKIELDSDDSICATSSSSQANNCIF